MKRFLGLVLLMVVGICSVIFTGCGGCNHVWNDGTIVTRATKTRMGEIEYVCDVCKETKQESYKLKAPTAAQTYSARQDVVNDNVEGYDFKFSLGADLSILGLGTSIQGNYEGQYRNNKTTNAETFYRKSSGALFFDSAVYSYTVGDNKVRIDLDEDNVPEKISILPNSDYENFFINKTVVSLVDAIKTEYISKVEIANNSSSYDFAAKLNFSANVPILSTFTKVLGSFGTKISFKNVEFVNPAAVPINFSIDEKGKLNDFELELEFEISIKMAKVLVFLRYEQTGSNSTIQIPNINGLSMDSEKINADVATINQAINAVKNSDTYSIDAVAKNEFDPAWNKLATVDKYTARLYKNKVDENVWFNHSYEYKAHHEDDGAEKYAFTIGNITDGSTHIISRKGSNKANTISEVSADTQFDYLTSTFVLNTSDIDCIYSTTTDNTSVYNVHLNKSAALSIQDKVLSIVNSNDEQGVVDVNNYMNSQVIIKKAVFVITITDGVLESISIETDLKYNPVDGEYTDYNITLTNVLELKINKELNKAKEYIAPDKVEGNILQDALINAKYYIL